MFKLKLWKAPLESDQSVALKEEVFEAKHVSPFSLELREWQWPTVLDPCPSSPAQQSKLSHLLKPLTMDMVIPEAYCCPIHQLMRNTVITSYRRLNHVYSGKKIC